MSKTWKRILWLLAIIIAVIVAGKIFGGSGDESKVTVEKSAYRDILETVSASGKIQPEIEVKIQSEVSGQIVELPIKEGDFVIKGQLLVKINPDLYLSAMNRSEATVNSARSNLSSARARLAQTEAQFKATNLNYQRQQKLFVDGAISKSELETITSTWETSKSEVVASKESINSAEFSIASALASLNEANDNLKRTTILAPMSGTVTALNKELGETVLGNNMMSGDIIMKISAMDVMEVNVEVNESDIVRVNMGDTAMVEVDAYKDQKFKGLVTEISNSALNSATAALSMDQVTNFSVKIRILPESYAKLADGRGANYSPFKPGMSATVDVVTEHAMHVLTVPIKSVTAREDTSAMSMAERLKQRMDSEKSTDEKEPITVVFVYNEASHKAEIRAVQTGIQDDKFIHIKQGISDGEQVITGPYEEVTHKLKTAQSVSLKQSGDTDEVEEDESKD